MQRNFTTLLQTLGLFVSTITFAQTGNVGINTTNPGSTLTVNGSFAATYRSVTTNGNVAPTDYYLAYNGNTSGTLILPAAISGSGNFMGRTYHFKNTGTAALSIAANGTELIDNQTGAGVPTINVPPGYYAFFISKGTMSGITWELILLSSSDSIPAAATTYPFSTISTTTRQSLTASTGPYIRKEINYPQGTVINTGNVLDIGNGRFTAPSDGYYMFYGSTQFDNGNIPGTPNFDFVVLYLMKNYAVSPDNILVQSFQPNPGTLTGRNVSCITYLNKNETVSMAAAAGVTGSGIYQVVVSSLYGYKIAN
ncbi:hypothetical protein CEY12_01480 [Chryseobacterium sp. T16E-39]|uniref:hypothetical protein n=1 Tax=Chryseobacterium sp. T16E-39 TaxID=2015076 RepID=UPI000B5B19A4|nr:hypothetical protein [Chryseobacterium sp. T16E-39]ASK28857.1 hypothetical protein CEY12_01480 [Chryseobacterium sp. T16E-39]